MKRIFTLLFAVSIIIFVTGCGGEGDESEDSYYPLTIGNEWNYETTWTLDIAGTPYIYQGEIQDRVIGTTQLTTGTNVFQFTTALTLNGYSDTDTFYLHETDTAVYVYESLDDTSPDKYIQFPLENSSTWVVNSTQTAVVLGIVDVSVPAGDYSDCWEIAYLDGDDTVFVYLAHGIGEVKGYAIDISADTTLAVSLELESATIQ